MPYQFDIAIRLSEEERPRFSLVHCMLVALFCGLVGVGVLIGIDQITGTGIGIWTPRILLAFPVYLVLAFLVSMFLNRWARRREAEAENIRRIRYVLDDKGITLSTPPRRWKKTLNWNQIRTLWNLPQSLILFYTDTQYLILPLDQLPHAAHDFLVEKSREFGGRIKNLG